ncbi:MOSC domain-containing protein [Streptomyces olindensis]|uniref:MOSC domain-containing protein n=1 Tax=Streptomyces olindensis TaxID=358823 RepID=A0ABV2XT94_9ACTN
MHVSVLTTATLDWVRSAVPDVPVDERRFRPNLLVRTPSGTPPFVEDEWFGSKARIGDAVCIEFVRSSERCVMTNEAQQEPPHSPLILRAITQAHDIRLDGLATVVSPGQVRIGDPLVLLQDPSRSRRLRASAEVPVRPICRCYPGVRFCCVGALPLMCGVASPWEA